jgi:hypothetical protein
MLLSSPWLVFWYVGSGRSRRALWALLYKEGGSVNKILSLLCSRELVLRVLQDPLLGLERFDLDVQPTDTQEFVMVSPRSMRGAIAMLRL